MLGANLGLLLYGEVSVMLAPVRLGEREENCGSERAGLAVVGI